MYVCMYKRMYVFVFMYMSLSLSVCVFVCVCARACALGQLLICFAQVCLLAFVLFQLDGMMHH